MNIQNIYIIKLIKEICIFIQNCIIFKKKIKVEKMKQKVKYILITSALVLATFCFLSPRTIAGYPDRWVVASSHKITLGYPHSGTIRDTYYNDGEYLVGKCLWLWTANSFKIKFDFSNDHYKRVRVDATTDPLGYDGLFCVDAVYTTGKVRLGCFSPGYTGYFTTDSSKVLDKVIVEYSQTGVWGQRKVYIDEIRALWTDFP